MFLRVPEQLTTTLMTTTLMTTTMVTTLVTTTIVTTTLMTLFRRLFSAMHLPVITSYA
jgi:hypothetical protein